MRIYLLRHGTAEAREVDGGDRPERALVSRGRAQAVLAGRLLRALGRLDHALTSPYVRARQTAEVALAAFAPPPPLGEHAALAPGASVEAALAAIFGVARAARREALAGPVDNARILAVGHEPLLSEIASQLIGGGGAAIDLRKGGLLELDVLSRDPPRAALLGLLRPRHLR